MSLLTTRTAYDSYGLCTSSRLLNIKSGELEVWLPFTFNYIGAFSKRKMGYGTGYVTDMPIVFSARRVHSATRRVDGYYGTQAQCNHELHRPSSSNLMFCSRLWVYSEQRSAIGHQTSRISVCRQLILLCPSSHRVRKRGPANPLIR